MRFITYASCSLRIGIDFVREEKLALQEGRKTGEASLRFRTKHAKPVLCATGYKSFPNIGLTYRFENSAARKQPICIRITRNIPRDVRLLDASACLAQRQPPQKEKEASQKEVTRGRRETLLCATTVSLCEVEASSSPAPPLYDRTVCDAVSKLIDGDDRY